MLTCNYVEKSQKTNCMTFWRMESDLKQNSKQLLLKHCDIKRIADKSKKFFFTFTVIFFLLRIPR